PQVGVVGEEREARGGAAPVDRPAVGADALEGGSEGVGGHVHVGGGPFECRQCLRQENGGVPCCRSGGAFDDDRMLRRHVRIQVFGHLGAESAGQESPV